jgi:hypothetical protein
VAVVIEDADGRIVRHLAYGVLGANAPEPLKKDSLEQELVWDGEDDAGRPVANLSGHSVRVSLGLKARLERNLFWHPKKRIGLTYNPLMVAQPEGVYVYEGASVETIRLFGHDGKMIVPEAIPNPARGYASRIDNRGDVYVLLSGRRKYDDGYVTLNSSGCVMKFRVGKGELPDTQ